MAYVTGCMVTNQTLLEQKSGDESIIWCINVLEKLGKQ